MSKSTEQYLYRAERHEDILSESMVEELASLRAACTAGDPSECLNQQLSR